MSGSIVRSYLIQSWNGASEYSGEMLGNRLKQSTQLFLANGQANTWKGETLTFNRKL